MVDRIHVNQISRIGDWSLRDPHDKPNGAMNFVFRFFSFQFL